MSTSQRGFTLIELLVVIAIICVLAAILFPVFSTARIKARQVNDASNLKQLSLAIIQYTQDYDDTYVPSGLMGYFADYEASRPHVMWFGSVDFSQASQPTDATKGPLWPYLKDARVAVDPTLDSIPNPQGDTDYGYNVWYLGGAGDFVSGPAEYPGILSKVLVPSDTVLLQDNIDLSSGSPAHYPWAFPPSWTAEGQVAPSFQGRYLGFGNVAYADGHVKAIIPKYISFTPSSGQPITPSQAEGFSTGFITKGTTLTDECYNGTGLPT